MLLLGVYDVIVMVARQVLWWMCRVENLFKYYIFTLVSILWV